MDREGDGIKIKYLYTISGFRRKQSKTYVRLFSLRYLRDVF